jgi:hypothetical protein
MKLTVIISLLLVVTCGLAWTHLTVFVVQPIGASTRRSAVL